MKLKMLAGGKLKGSMGNLCQNYAQRIDKFFPFELNEISESAWSEKQLAQRLQEQAQKVRKLLKARSLLIVLDEAGQSWRSHQLANQLEKWMGSGLTELVFLIGGAYGVEENIKKEAKQIWSLSPLTLPHGLARVVALEQIYRALTIIKGVPYHHE